MKCTVTREDLIDVALGAASPDVACAVAEHARTCARCAAELSADRRLARALTQIDAPPTSAGFRARTLARLAVEREFETAAEPEVIPGRLRRVLAVARRQVRESRFAQAAVAAAAVYLIAIVAWVAGSRGSRPADTLPPVAKGPEPPIVAPSRAKGDGRTPAPFLPRGELAEDAGSFRPRPDVDDLPRVIAPEPVEPFSPDVVRDFVTRTERDNAVTAVRERFRARLHPPHESTARSAADRAILNGLKWLTEAQDPDGSWDPARFGGREETRVGNTALATLALLTNAENGIPGGIYRFHVARAFAYLRDAQDASGTFGRQRGWEDATLFNHATTTLAFAEHYVLSKRADTLYLPALQDGLLRLEDMASQRAGRQRRDSDRVTAPWVALALETARAAAIPGAKDLDRSARAARDAVAELLPETAEGRRVAASFKEAVAAVYSPTAGPSGAAGAPRDATIDDLLRPLSSAKTCEPTEVYFGAVLVESRGGADRDRFRAAASGALLPWQREDGSFHTEFWWDPVSEAGGDLYVTTLSILTLSVPYRIGR